MKVVTASEASRAFSAVLDSAERGETITVTRGGVEVARITPVATARWGALREVLADWVPPDDPTIEADMAVACADI